MRMNFRRSIFASTLFFTALSCGAFAPSPFLTNKLQKGLNLEHGSEATELHWKPLRFSEQETAMESKVRERPFEVPDLKALQSDIALNAQEALSPFSETFDDITGGWALSYADLSPESETTLLGQSFLATNVAYAIVGLLLGMQGDVLLGTLTEIASVASFVYHYTQLQASNNRTVDSTVRLALSIDYICASTAIFVGLVYLALDHQLPPMEAIASGTAGILFLGLGWVWEYGYPYLFTHSLWHLFSAYTAFVVGNAHLSV